MMGQPFGPYHWGGAHLGVSCLRVGNGGLKWLEAFNWCPGGAKDLPSLDLLREHLNPDLSLQLRSL